MCHSERSEESELTCSLICEILRCAQNDNVFDECE